jgi:hypothetical protein
MIKESHRVMIALLALLACVAIARADSMTVSTGCGPGRGEPCMGYVNVSSTAASGSLFPIYFSGLADQPGILDEFRWDVPWFFGFDTAAGTFSMMDGGDADMTIRGRVTKFDLTRIGLLHQRLAQIWIATDSVQWIDQEGRVIDIPQTGAAGGGIFTELGDFPQAGFSVGFDLSAAASIPEPGTFALLSVGLLALVPLLLLRA